MRILLLGSTGYVGSVFAEHIRKRGHELTTIGRQDCDFFAQEALQVRSGIDRPTY